MARRCSITGKGGLAGNRVSHAHNTTRMRQFPNVQKKRIFIPEYNRSVRIKLAASSLRSIEKMGFLAFLRKNNLSLRDIT